MKDNRSFNHNFLIILTLLFSACTTYKPIIGVNDRYNFFGKKRVEQEISICIEEAELMIKDESIKEAYYSTGDILVNGIASALSNSIENQVNPRQAIINSTISSSANGINSSLNTFGQKKIDPEKATKNYIIRCLSRKGLVVIGWN